jgi:hypothetical protein
MFDRIRSILRRIEEIREVDAMSDSDLADLGLTRGQLHEFLRMPRDIEGRVTAMAAIFGVTGDQLKRDHGEWVDLLSTCGHCTDRAACAGVLEEGESAHPADASFCANRQVFTRLARHA